MTTSEFHFLQVPRLSCEKSPKPRGYEVDLLAPSSIPSVAELPIIKQIPSLVRQGGRFVDAGAHVGFYTASLAGCFDQVDAYEPSRIQFNLLRRNLERNNLTNCRAIPKALGADFETKDILVTGRSGGSNTLARSDTGEEPMDTYPVEVVPLDAAGYSDLSFLKIDVEGWELEVLRGASNTLRVSRPVVLVEVWELVSQRRAVCNFLADHSYNFIFPFDNFPELALCTPQRNI